MRAVAAAAPRCGSCASTTRARRPCPSWPIRSTTRLAIVALTWAAATDNIQVESYEILRTASRSRDRLHGYVDVAPIEHAELSYVVRAVDTNGNSPIRNPR